MDCMTRMAKHQAMPLPPEPARVVMVRVSLASTSGAIPGPLSETG